MSSPAPGRDLETAGRAAGYQHLTYIDECGRGSVAGPLVVCAATIGTTSPPAGLADSKLLTVRRREQLAPLLRDWVTDHTYGVVTAAEIDSWGMAHALHVAAHRALDHLRHVPDLIVLDGPHDYIRHPATATWARARADQTEVGVAAASVLGKTYHDHHMRTLDVTYPGYDLGTNFGYLSAAHRSALRTLGPTPEHRTTWKFMDALPQWTHLRRITDQPGGVPTLPL